MQKIESYLKVSDIVSYLTVTPKRSPDDIKLNDSQTFLYSIHDNSIIGTVNLGWTGKNDISTGLRTRFGGVEIKIGETIIVADLISIDKNCHTIDYPKIIYAKTTDRQEFVVIESNLDGDILQLVFEIITL